MGPFVPKPCNSQTIALSKRPCFVFFRTAVLWQIGSAFMLPRALHKQVLPSPPFPVGLGLYSLVLASITAQVCTASVPLSTPCSDAEGWCYHRAQIKDPLAYQTWCCLTNVEHCAWTVGKICLKASSCYSLSQTAAFRPDIARPASTCCECSLAQFSVGRISPLRHGLFTI